MPTFTLYVCRVIGHSGDIWSHNGTKNGNEARYVGNIVNYNMRKLQTVGDYTMCLLVYIKLINRDGS